MKYFGKILLFLSSYLPVWVIYALSQGFTLNAISLFGISLTIISISTILIFKATYETPTRRSTEHIFIENVSNGSSEAISYLLSLIIPVATSTIPFQLFGGSFSQNFQNEIITIVVGLAIFFIYIRSNLVVMNPIMMLSGYSLYIITYKPKVESKTTFDAVLITKKSDDLTDIAIPTRVTRIEQDVYLYRC
jgi:hypothetical protein